MNEKEMMIIENEEQQIKRNKKKGQSLVEYGLILALVSVVAITVLQLMGGEIQTTVENITDKMQDANTWSDDNS